MLKDDADRTGNRPARVVNGVDVAVEYRVERSSSVTDEASQRHLRSLLDSLAAMGVERDDGRR
ncbi:MAG: hypothetical protein M3450_02870 [Actinomycetota bacterium]|nr:hypothetical protein [Actinomycetota bacterium]